MHPDTAASLIALNQRFYTQFGQSFSATRHRLQPGVRRVLETLRGDESILDLGCGNGELARELAKRGHRGSYLGVDFSPPLLQDAKTQPEGFSVQFLQADLTRLSKHGLFADGEKWNLVTAFAVLHHIPSEEIRSGFLHTIRELLAQDGAFILSNWQFLNSEKLKARIQDWSQVGLSTADVDPNDYLLDWRSGGQGLRYVHHFSESELATLAQHAGFTLRETFYSDGETGNLGLYQVWEPASTG